MESENRLLKSVFDTNPNIYFNSSDKIKMKVMNAVKILLIVAICITVFSFFYIPMFFKGAVDPATLISAAEEFLKSNFGSDYFSKYLSFNSINGSTVVYDYTITVGNYSATQKVWVDFDQAGNIIGSEGIVDCVGDSSKCMPFEIDREQAIEIAKGSGLGEGTIGYGANMQYSEEAESYVWDVRSLMKELEKPPEEGEGVWVDPSTGEVVGSFKFPEYG